MSKAQPSACTHLVAGCVGGTTAATLTCPLEVIKTRLQSSAYVVRPVMIMEPATLGASPYGYSSVSEFAAAPRGLLRCFRHIVVHEGLLSLFKGLGPTLVGIAPTRALYFTAYAESKAWLNTRLDTPDTPLVHLASAAAAGGTASTLTSPIWVVKTRIQLDTSRRGERPNVASFVKQMYRREGIQSFYRGLTASYAGLLETGLHFVLYERFKKMKKESSAFGSLGVFDLMSAAACAKVCASCCAYPHEVVRTRLRECSSNRRYHSFFQTLMLVWKEERFRGLYGGLSAHLLRVVPNSAIMFAAYELVADFLTSKV